MTTLYQTHLEQTKQFSDYAEQIQAGIQETIELLQLQLDELELLKKTAIDFSVTNDMISNDNLHSLEFLNCSAVELTKIASAQRQLLIQRRRTKGIVTWIENNDAWTLNLTNLLQKYVPPVSSYNYNYRTTEGFELLQSFPDATARMNTKAVKPSASVNKYFKRNILQALETKRRHHGCTYPENIDKPTTVEVKVQAKPLAHQFDFIPLNQPVKDLDVAGFFKISRNRDMRNVPLTQTNLRYGISKKASSFVLYDLENSLLLFQSLKITSLFGFLKEHAIDLTSLCCHPFYFPTLSHYIHDSLTTKQVGSLDIPFIKKVATTSFDYKG